MVFFWNARTFKVIPQKQTLPMNFFLNFPLMFSTKHCFEKSNKNDTSPFSLKAPSTRAICIWYLLFARVDDTKWSIFM